MNVETLLRATSWGSARCSEPDAKAPMFARLLRLPLPIEPAEAAKILAEMPARADETKPQRRLRRMLVDSSG